MIIKEQGDNVIKSCFASPLFELLFSRIRVTIKHLISFKNNAGEFEQREDGETQSPEITDSVFIDPATKIISQEQLEGTYPAYSFILATKIQDLFPDWETKSKEQIGATPVYSLIADQVESIIQTNEWHLTNG